MTTPKDNGDVSIPRVITPDGETQVLLHICCAVCAGSILESLVHSGIETTAFFYNPNIDTPEEYQRRKEEHLRYAEKLGVRCVDADYDPEHWAKAVEGLEEEPERGARCDRCFELRLIRAAQCAAKCSIPLLATTLGISRWKDLDQVNRAGERAVLHAPSVRFWACNWRRQGGSQRMSVVAKQETFYRQDYCGCVYSHRSPDDRNLGRTK